MQILCYPKCTTCQKAVKHLDSLDVKYQYRHIKDEHPTYDELKSWYEKSGLEIKKFFNTSGILYKEMQLKDKIANNTLDDNLKLLASNGMLVKRPMIIDGDNIIIGYKEEMYNSYFKKDK